MSLVPYFGDPDRPSDLDAESAAELMLATLNGLAFRWVLEPRFDFAGHARRLVHT